MRKYEQKQFIELIETVLEGIEYAFSKKEQPEAAQNMLSDCYSAAAFIKENITGAVSEKKSYEYYADITEIQSLLESLNRAIFLQHNIMNVFSLLKIKVTELSDKIQNEKIILEAVFLPYKASMWDSLESIWRAANDDEDCNAVVIPIPYFDRNSDRTLGEMHYEGAEYPDYVPITDWTKYDLRVHKPDMIYFHNPYDQYNYATTVHPTFYSGELKKHTDMLVYIPYFISPERNPDNKADVKHMKNFCTIQGVINADRVIVQSENIRQIYINVLLEVLGSPDKYRKDLNEKILGLGSPKLDKVINTKKEDLDIPDEWLKIIEKPDGSRKKIIFYNTTLNVLLRYGDKYIENIKDVFSVFKENTDDIALLWRPHPLMETTIKAMRGDLYEKYHKLVMQYKSDGWGIYDDSADLDRTIVLCDAYYGDCNSVEDLVRAAGKPVTIQNIEAINADDFLTDIKSSDEPDNLSAKKYSGNIGRNIYYKIKETIAH